MTKIKGKKKLNSAILNELHSFGIASAKLSNEYAYIKTKKAIKFSIELPIEYEWLVDFISERFNYTCDFPFVLLFLHEVGHHKTINTISAEVQKFCDDEKVRISSDMMLTENENEWKKLEYQYYALPDEIMATKWAVDFARQHPKKVQKMAERMTASFQEFYEKNGVTEDE